MAKEAPDKPRKHEWSWKRIIQVVLLVAALLVLVPLGARWLHYRFTHSITDNAFVESDLVNVAPLVAGHIAEMLVDDGDAVQTGQLLARIDETDYRRQVELAQAGVEVTVRDRAKAVVTAERSAKELDVKIAIAERDLAIAEDSYQKAQNFLELTTRNIEEGIRAATDGVRSAQATLDKAKQDYDRFTKLFEEESVPKAKLDAATMAYKTAQANLEITLAKLAQAEAARSRIEIAGHDLQSAEHGVERARKSLELARLGHLEVEEDEKEIELLAAEVEAARKALDVAETNLEHTRILAPFDGVVAKKFLNAGGFVSPGYPVVSIYDPENLYVTANLEETKLEGVAVGNGVDLDADAFNPRFRGKVIKIGKATGANFALIPRDNSAGEFTKVVQRVPIKIAIQRDDRWSKLRPGLSVTVGIEHSEGE